MLFAHSEDIQNVARHARQTKDPQSFVVAVLDLLDRAGRSLAVARLGSEAVDHFSTQAFARHMTPIKVTDVTVVEIDRVAAENPSWASCKNETLNDLHVYIGAVSDRDFLFSCLFVPEN